MGPGISVLLCHRESLLIEANRSLDVASQHHRDCQVRKGEGCGSFASLGLHLERLLEVFFGPGEITAKEHAQP
jgi:hypothetical protein